MHLEIPPRRELVLCFCRGDTGADDRDLELGYFTGRNGGIIHLFKIRKHTIIIEAVKVGK